MTKGHIGGGGPHISECWLHCYDWHGHSIHLHCYNRLLQHNLKHKLIENMFQYFGSMESVDILKSLFWNTLYIKLLINLQGNTDFRVNMKNN